MTEEQAERLAKLQSRLIDVFLEEADPDNWSGAGLKGAEMSKEERGDRHWDKKSAAGTMMLMAGVEKLTANTKEALGRDPLEEDDLDKQISQAEKEASVRAEAVIGKARKGIHTDGKANAKTPD